MLARLVVTSRRATMSFRRSHSDMGLTVSKGPRRILDANGRADTAQYNRAAALSYAACTSAQSATPALSVAATSSSWVEPSAEFAAANAPASCLFAAVI